MLKMYHDQSHSGNESEFWEKNWAAGKFEESVSFMAIDPLRPLFEKYLKSDSSMLEGGCGMGNYIAYYAARNYDVVGLDFAQTALTTLRIRQPDLKLVAGDVSNIPFPEKTFDLYYSGGVVEHFESGAAESLREARRVIKDDGILLISVPYYNPLRRILTSFRRDEWREVNVSDADDGINGKKFFQYAYKTKEFKKMLSEAGLRTIDTQGYAVLWGLQDLPFVNRQDRSEFPAQREQVQNIEPTFVDVNSLIKDKRSPLIKRLVVSEDDTVPVFGLGVKFMRWAFANMMMYVCVRN